MGTTESLAREELARRELARRHLRDFVPYTFPGYKVRPHNVLIADAVELCVYGIIDRLIINCPPQYGKSEILSRRTPAFKLGRSPDSRVMLASYNAALAYDLSRNARDIIGSLQYRNLFGDMSCFDDDPVALAEDSRSVSSWNIGGHRGGMVAAGIGGGLTGKSSDFTIIDDPLKDDVEAQSELIREQQFNWYWSVAHTRLSPGAPVIITQTRWHEEDLTGKILKQAPDIGEFWWVLRLPAIAETPDETQKWADLHNVSEKQWLTRERVDALLEKIDDVG